MASNFPTQLDVLANPTGANSLSDGAVLHSGQHTNANDAIEALQTKVGVNGSAVATSIDNKLANHLHTGTYVKVPAAAGLDLGSVLVRDSSLAEGVKWAFLAATGAVINVKDFAATSAQRAAMGVGTSKPLSTYYGTLAEAQAAYPHATALTNEMEWAVIQAAINSITSGTLWFPPGVYTAPGLQWKSHIIARGAGRFASKLRSASGDLINIAGDHWGFYDMGFDGAGGHIFTQTGHVSEAKLVGCRFVQFLADKSVWKNNDFNYIDILVFDFTSVAHSANTVPAWDFISSLGGVNRNTWSNGRHTYSSGAPAWKMDSSSATSYIYDNVWRDVNFEVCVGGGVWLGGNLDPLMEGCVIYDTTNATADFISVGPGSGGLQTIGGTWINCARRASTFTGSFRCWTARATGSGGGKVMINCNGTSAGASWTADFALGSGSVVIPGAWSTITQGDNSTNLKGAASFAGDIETKTVGTGFILKSPDGTRYRVTVANGGALSAVAV